MRIDQIKKEFFYMEHPEKINEFDIDEYTKAVEDSFGDIHFWKKRHDGWSKVCIIEFTKPNSKSMYDYVLWGLNRLERKNMVEKVYRGEPPSNLASALEYQFRVRVPEDVWDRLEAARLARRMIYGE